MLHLLRCICTVSSRASNVINMICYSDNTFSYFPGQKMLVNSKCKGIEVLTTDTLKFYGI